MESGKSSVVEALLGHGAQVHIRGGKIGEAPLHIACRIDEAKGEQCSKYEISTALYWAVCTGNLAGCYSSLELTPTWPWLMDGLRYILHQRQATSESSDFSWRMKPISWPLMRFDVVLLPLLQTPHSFLGWRDGSTQSLQSLQLQCSQMYD